ncbi:hypothetical protein HAX54_049256 [Datura stramonium]|uniref:MBD domain-containing protein n=1 Tax=Datura stramonium TaxID=4076 RepID=A0ABS8SV90_DATST|nr:hypothetical protein [Datura stramonium]
MTEAAPVSSIPTETVNGGEFRDDCLPSDPLLQSGTYIDAESNVSVETTTPNKGVPDEGNASDLAPAPAATAAAAAVAVAVAAESTLEMQITVSKAETVTPQRRQNRSVDVNAERPSWLPDNWNIETRVRTSGATAGTVDRYYHEPGSGRKFRSKNEVLYFLETGKRKKANTGSDPTTPSDTTSGKKQKKSGSKTKKVTSFYFDSVNPPHSVCWVQTDSNADTWAASCNGSMVPEGRKQEWDAVFSSVSQLRRRTTQVGR